MSEMSEPMSWQEASRAITSVVPARLEAVGNAAVLMRMAGMFGDRDTLTDAGIRSFNAKLIGLAQVGPELFSVAEVSYYRELPVTKRRFRRQPQLTPSSVEKVLTISALHFDGTDVVRGFVRANLRELSDLQAPKPIRSFVFSVGADEATHVDAATELTDRTVASLLVAPDNATATLKVHNPDVDVRINHPAVIGDLDIGNMWLPRSTVIYEAYAAMKQGISPLSM